MAKNLCQRIMFSYSEPVRERKKSSTTKKKLDGQGLPMKEENRVFLPSLMEGPAVIQSVI